MGLKPNDEDDPNQRQQVLTNQTTRRLIRKRDLYFKAGKDACISSKL
jgi:hypothetical protein